MNSFVRSTIRLRIGAGSEQYIYKAPQDGDRYAFANDIATDYEDNKRNYMAKVTRVS